MTSQEMREELRARRRSQYYGKRYHYNNPQDGRIELGVLQGLGDAWFVGYIRENGSRRAFKSPLFRGIEKPDELHAALVAYATAHQLEEVA